MCENVYITRNKAVQCLLLGRLPKVNLIKAGKCPSVHLSVRPSTKGFLDLNEIWYVDRGR